MKKTDYQKMNGFFTGPAGDGQEDGGTWRPERPFRPESPLPADISPVDWVCGGLLLLAAVLSICFWDRLSDALFFGVLFPLITAGGELLFVLAVLAFLLEELRRKLRRIWH